MPTVDACDDHDCETIAVALPGPRGPRGPAGPPGPPGGATGDYIHTQTTPSTQWLVTHNLGRDLVGALVYSADYSTEYTNVQVEPLNTNQCRLSMTPATAGVARIF